MKFSQKLKRVATALSLLMVFQVAFSQLIPASKADAATGPGVSFKVTGEPKVGNIIDIAVNVSDVTGLYGGSVDFKYDTTLLEVQSIAKGDAFGTTAVQMPVNQVKNGEANIGFTMTGTASKGVTFTGAKTLAIIKAKVLAPGTVKLNATNSNDALSLTGNTARVKLSNDVSAVISYTATNSSIVIPTNDALSITSFTPDKVNQPVGSPVKFTAQASKAGVEYDFYVRENRAWSCKQVYSSSNTFTWVPNQAGVYTIRVRARLNGVLTYKDITYNVTASTIKAKMNSFAPDKTAPTVGTKVTFTALANAGSQYDFYVKENGVWVCKQAYSYTNTFAWTPTKAGTYNVRARAKINNTFDYKDITIVVK